MRTPIYLDYAAATPLDKEAIAAIEPYQQAKFFNPSAAYEPARAVRRDLETARGIVADVLGCKDQEVIFTAGGTEANNLAIYGIMSQYPNANIVVSSIEHESVLEPAELYEKRIAPVNKNGLIDLKKLAELIDENTILISIMYANNEIGTVQPLREIAALIQKQRTLRAAANSQKTIPLPLFFHTDACQAANYLDLQVTRLGVDLMTLNGGKIYAPKQSGALYVRAGIKLHPLIYGGGQERALRSGTENVGASIAFATMLQKVQSDRKSEANRVEKLRDLFFANLSQKIPTLTLNGDKTKRLPNNLNILIPDIDGERMLMELDEREVLAATGSACTASNDEPSHVLLALGLTDKEASSSLRFTLGRQTTKEQIEEATSQVVHALEALQKLV